MGEREERGEHGTCGEGEGRGEHVGREEGRGEHGTCGEGGGGMCREKE